MNRLTRDGTAEPVDYVTRSCSRMVRENAGAISVRANANLIYYSAFTVQLVRILTMGTRVLRL